MVCARQLQYNGVNASIEDTKKEEDAWLRKTT